MSTMMPTDVRANILAEHNGIRGDLEQLTQMAASAPLQRDAVLRRFDELAERIERHREYEEKHLEPILRDQDAWSDVRVSSMHVQHRYQANLIARAREEIQVGSPRALSRAVRVFRERIQVEMAQEEEFLIPASRMRDDLVVADAFGG